MKNLLVMIGVYCATFYGIIMVNCEIVILGLLITLLLQNKIKVVKVCLMWKGFEMIVLIVSPVIEVVFHSEPFSQAWVIVFGNT